ncbi:DNA adenine methylase [Shewanella sp. Isolate8]|uniref:DNA adenine methylase n=1 Tax=Shewanella sp. Isolate8 TaxID=2908529 RepID=UPI001EFDDABE|nr:DNA adenine methylase [Shewanella sp. Isolate8]MCG9745049.1 DNA adenine methylase [Shewanella sp. Isolate8]
MTFRYIGSKARFTEEIVKYVGKPTSDSGRFVDVFCGTGAVAAEAHKLGWNVWINDHLISAVTMASARMMSFNHAKFLNVGGYSSAIETLNNVPGINGVIWREYSPVSLKLCGIERKYFTEHNAQKIDGIRKVISEWYSSGKIDGLESEVLIADLISAVNRVANIAGTYGCFLSKWQKQALSELKLKERDLNDSDNIVETTNLDAFELNVTENDVVYLDPPYTKRQYASYYHILETITINDNPTVEGVSGLRPWKHKASVFCYKRKALRSLVELITKLKSKKVILSYSCEGHVDLNELVTELELTGSVKLIPLASIGRYRPNKVASSNGDTVTEYLVEYSGVSGL